MFRRKLFLLGAILFTAMFLVWTVSFADELSDIQTAIKKKGAKWVAGETSMTKLSKEERKKRLGLILDLAPIEEQTVTFEEQVAFAPASLDWRNNAGDYVTPVRNQGNCGSCWAFGTTAALESATLIAHGWSGVNLDLAEQILVSCSSAGDCGGGYIGSASSYIRNTGLPEEPCFPYRALDSHDNPPVTCDQACPNWWNSTYQIDGYSWVAATVDAIKNALNTNGPLVTTMAVYNDFFSYTGGVYTHVYGSLAGYHAVLIIGYDDPGQYFIVKNSWGAGWGSTSGYGSEKGYFMIAYSQMSSDVSFGASTLAYSISSETSSIALTDPNGGETWQAGTSQTISWAYTGNPGSSVKIELYKGSSLNRTITLSTPLARGSYAWTIPSDVSYGTDYLIKITSTSSSTSDMSDGYFTINAAPAFITVVSPNGGQNWQAGSTQTIAWTYVGNPGSYVKIELYRGSSLNRTVTSSTPLASGSYAWTIPSDVSYGTDYLIKITSTSSSTSDISDSYFAINAAPVQGSITVISPNGGQTYKAESTQTITWTSAGNPGSYVKIELLKSSVLNRTISSRASMGSGSFAWKIHTKQTPGSDYRIRITSTSDATVKDTSDADFTVSKK